MVLPARRSLHFQQPAASLSTICATWFTEKWSRCFMRRKHRRSRQSYRNFSTASSAMRKCCWFWSPAHWPYFLSMQSATAVRTMHGRFPLWQVRLPMRLLWLPEAWHWMYRLHSRWFWSGRRPAVWLDLFWSFSCSVQTTPGQNTWNMMTTIIITT